MNILDFIKYVDVILVLYIITGLIYLWNLQYKFHNAIIVIIHLLLWILLIFASLTYNFQKDILKYIFILFTVVMEIFIIKIHSNRRIIDLLDD